MLLPKEATRPYQRGRGEKAKVRLLGRLGEMFPLILLSSGQMGGGYSSKVYRLLYTIAPLIETVLSI